ncbi:MAG TPA: hypothetical protein VKU80_14210, partial [Planctomycetota bacterium]|nr:hypothetical protein [Planctomycetota bacterium]
MAELEVRHEFLTLDRLDPTDQFAAKQSAYVVLGYPTVLSGPGPTVFSTNGMLFGGLKYSGDPSLIRDFTPDVHVAIEWSDVGMVDLDGIRQSLPEPGGISGGAIWRTIESGDGLIRPRLVGLVQRWEKKPSVIIGTQIEYALGLIWRSLPGTAAVMNLQLP